MILLCLCVVEGASKEKSHKVKSDKAAKTSIPKVKISLKKDSRGGWKRNRAKVK